MIFIVSYVLLCAVLLFFITKANWPEWCFKMCIVTFLPVIGWFLPSIWPKKWIKKDPHFFENYLEIQTSEIPVDILQTLSKVESSEELNVISIEEALLVNDYSTRRRVLIDALKEDAMQFIDVLKTAVTNEDTETSHYAVTAVIEVKRELMLLMQKLAVEFSQNPNDPKIANAYAEIIKEYLRSGFLDSKSVRQYKVTYIQILQQLINNEQEIEENYLDKIDMELDLKDTIAAENTSRQFKSRFPLCEQAILSTIKIYFEARAYDKIQQEIETLKGLPITLSNEALTVVRYWSGVNKS